MAHLLALKTQLLPRLTTTSVESLFDIKDINLQDVLNAGIDKTDLGRYIAPRCSHITDCDVDIKNVEVDARFSITGLSTTKERSLVIGRKWASARNYELNIGYASDWGGHNIAFVPAVGAVAATIADRNLATAISSIPLLFSTTQPTNDIGPSQRNSMTRLSQMQVNSVRMMYRLALLWHGVSMAERKVKEVRVSRSGSEDIRFIENAAAWCSTLTDIGGRDAVPYKVQYSVAEELSNIMVIVTAAASGISYNVRGLPRVLLSMPALKDPMVTIYGMQQQLPASLTITSSAVWSAAVEWSTAYGDVGVFLELVDSVSVLLFSHNGRAPVTGTTGMRIALPESSMSGLYLGPLTQRFRDWEESTIILVQPKYEALVATGVQMSLNMGLAWRSVAEMHSAPLLYSARGKKWAHLHMQQVWVSKRVACSANVMAQAIIDAVWPGVKMGRMLSAYSFTTGGIDQVRAWWNDHKGALQWEESLPTLKALPHECALRAVVSALKVTSPLIVNHWYRVGDLPNGLTPVGALMGLQYAREVELAVHVRKSGSISGRVETVDLPRGYRDAYSDWGLNIGGATADELIQPVIRFRTPEAIMRAGYGNVDDINVKWMITRISVTNAVDEVFNTYIDDGGGGVFHGGGGAPGGTEDRDSDSDGDYDEYKMVPSRHERRTSGGGGDHAAKSSNADKGKGKEEKDDEVKVVTHHARREMTSSAAEEVELDANVTRVQARLNLLNTPTKESEPLKRMVTAMETLPVLLLDGSGAESSVEVQGGRRRCVDGFLHIKPLEMLALYPHTRRAQVATAMNNLGSLITPFAANATETYQLALVKYQYSSLASGCKEGGGLLFDEEIRDWVSSMNNSKEGSIDFETLSSAMAAVPLHDMLLTGEGRGKQVNMLYSRWQEQGIKPKQVDRDVARRERVKKEADEARERELAEQEMQLKDVFMAGIVDAATVQEVMGYMPAWCSPDTVDMPHDIPKMMSDAATNAVIMVPTADGGAVSVADLSKEIDAGYITSGPSNTGSGGEPSNFGIDTKTTSGAPSAPPTTTTRRAQDGSRGVKVGEIGTLDIVMM